MFDMLGVQLSQPVADVFSFILAVPLSLSVIKEMTELEKQEEHYKMVQPSKD